MGTPVARFAALLSPEFEYNSMQNWKSHSGGETINTYLSKNKRFMSPLQDSGTH